MLCPDAALPTDTTGNNNGVVVALVVVTGEGWGEPVIQAVWGGVRLRCREGMEREKELEDGDDGEVIQQMLSLLSLGEI